MERFQKVIIVMMIFGILASIISLIITLFVVVIIWATLLSSSPMLGNPYRTMSSDNIPDVLQHRHYDRHYKKETEAALKGKRKPVSLNREVFIFLAGLSTLLGGFLLEYLA